MWPFEKKEISLPSSYKIGVVDSREDRPQFARTYTARMPSGTALEIKINRFRIIDDVWMLGSLTQLNGKYVFFDPRKVADKIIDRELLPSVEEAVSKILSLDSEFRKTKPPEFTDTDGVTWIRRIWS